MCAHHVSVERSVRHSSLHFSAMPKSPKLRAPPGACDCHMHIFDARYPHARPDYRKEADALVSEYREVQRRLGLERVVVVQPMAYGKDHRCTLDAMAELGPGAR